jgi:hypothetical protein
MTVETVAPAAETVVAPVAAAPVVAPAVAAAVEATPPVTPPVTPPAPVTPPVTPAPVGDSIEIVTYEPTGDPGLDIALEFVGKLGYRTDSPAMQAAMNGDYTLIEAELAALGPKAAGWERHVALAKAADERAARAAADTKVATDNACEKAVGGKEQWAAIQTWAVANASAEEKAAINAMFDLGPIAARMAAIAMSQAYRSAPGTVITPKDPLRDVAGSVPATGALSKREYTQAVQQLRQSMGRKFETSQEYADLRARHAAYRG